MKYKHQIIVKKYGLTICGPTLVYIPEVSELTSRDYYVGYDGIDIIIYHFHLFWNIIDYVDSRPHFSKLPTIINIIDVADRFIRNEIQTSNSDKEI